MNEDLSATIRTGVTVVIVAALVSTVLSLMVVAQTILTSGQGTLQAGVDRVSLQQYELYNGGSQSGTDVKAAISLYASQDVAILVHTKTTPTGKWWNYNSLLENATSISGVKANGVEVTAYQATLTEPAAGDSYYTAELKVNNGMIQYNGDKKGITTKGADQYVLDSARFSSMLIKDKNELIIGIVFTQRE